MDTSRLVGGDSETPFGGDPETPLGGDQETPLGGDPEIPLGGDPETPQRQQQLLITGFKKGHRPTDSGVSCVTTVSTEDTGDIEEGEEVTFKPSLPDSVKLDMPSPICRNEEEQEEQEEQDPSRIPGEPPKTFLSALFLAAGFFASVISLVF